jgi:nucleoside-diphosphate-sugar epimerase
MAKKPHALILGGTGFIGSSLLNALLINRPWRLSALVHKTIPRRKLDTVNLLHGSLGSFDLDWMREDPPEIVYHLARLSGRSKFKRLISAWRGKRANIRLLKSFSKLKVPPRIIYVSSLLMYGDRGDEKVNENDDLSPTSVAREQYLAEEPFLNEKNVAVTMVRSPWILSAGSWFKAYYWRYILKYKRVPLYGDGSNWMNLIHIDDLGSLLAHLGKQKNLPKVFHAFGHVPVRQYEFVSALAKELRLGITPISKKDMEKIFSREIIEVLTVSVKLSNSFPALLGGFRFQFAGLQEMLRDVITSIKNEQAVLP